MSEVDADVLGELRTASSASEFVAEQEEDCFVRLEVGEVVEGTATVELEEGGS